jgi:hypothetical protein
MHTVTSQTFAGEIAQRSVIVDVWEGPMLSYGLGDHVEAADPAAPVVVSSWERGAEDGNDAHLFELLD